MTSKSKTTTAPDQSLNSQTKRRRDDNGKEPDTSNQASKYLCTGKGRKHTDFVCAPVHCRWRLEMHTRKLIGSSDWDHVSMTLCSYKDSVGCFFVMQFTSQTARKWSKILKFSLMTLTQSWHMSSTMSQRSQMNLALGGPAHYSPFLKTRPMTTKPGD